MERAPNFLFIITDQHRADHLGCYGNPIVKTPNIDRLAQAATRFDNFYVATPICMPNRATFMTGRMPSLHGARLNRRVQKPSASQTSSVHGLSSIEHAVPRASGVPLQKPLPHWSSVVQSLKSSQVAVLAACTQLPSPSH